MEDTWILHPPPILTLSLNLSLRGTVFCTSAGW